MLMRMRMTMIEDESDGDALRPRGSGSMEIQWGLVSGGVEKMESPSELSTAVLFL